MTKEQLAALLNGREYGNEITEAEEELAREHSLVVLFGYSDDNAEFRGVLHEEIGCYDGGTILVTRSKVLSRHEDCECEWCGYQQEKRKAVAIHALWCKELGYSWTYKTDIPHATFDIWEGKDKYCRGIVFSINDLP